MERRAAGALLALAACLACSAAAPTSSNLTSLDVYDGATEGCYYNFQHYGEGDRIMTNEPCLNCTCHNRMLMCYLRVCPFTKPIGQDCTVEKRADQCCPIVTCPDVPVDLLTSTSTTSPQEYGGTGVGKLDKYGCSINGKYLPEGAKVPSSPDKPCEHCYCFRNITNCIMQECTLHVDGCTPIYHRDACCPVRYSCDHPEDETLMLDDMTTTVRPTPGFLLTTTTLSPVTQMSQDCVHDDQIFADGALIKTEKACEHCYCMKGDIVCVVQECGTPMENEGKNCTSLAPREGQCCPDTYICEGDELSTTEIITETTKEYLSAETTTLLPPKRTSIEGSGYRNEPDDTSFLGISTSEPEIEGSGDEIATKSPILSDENVIDDHEKPQLLEHNEDVATDDMLIFSSSTPSEILPKVTTEPDKGLNTVPISDEDIDQSVPEKTTPSYELVTELNEQVVTTEVTRRKENNLTQDLPPLTTMGSAFTNDEEQRQTTTVSSEILQEDLTTYIISEKETIASTVAPIHVDDNKEEQLTTTASDNINIAETSTIGAMGDSKIDTENKIEPTTPDAFDDDKEKVQSEPTTDNDSNIIKNIEDHMQSEVTTQQQTDNGESDNENTGYEKTTTGAIPDVKLDEETNILETTTIPALGSVKEGENIKPYATTISNIDNSKEDEEKLQSEPTTLSALDIVKENQHKIHPTPTTTTFLDGNEIKHSAETTKIPLGMDIETQEAIQSTSDVFSQDTTQSEVTTKGTSDSFVNDDDNMQSQATTASNIDSTKKDDQKTESVTTADSDKEQDDKNEFEATTTSGVDVVKEESEPVKPETTTQGAPNVVSEGTTTNAEDIIKEKKDQVQPESTTQISLKEVQENDLHTDTTTATNLGEDDVTTNASSQENDVLTDVNTTGSEVTQNTLNSDKQDKENIPLEGTTVSAMFGVKKDEEKIQSDFTTHSIIENEDVISFEPTSESPKEDEVNKQSETTTVGPNISVEDEYERDTPKITTQSSIYASKTDDDQNLKSEATTSTMELQTSSISPVDSFPEKNEEKIQSETTTVHEEENDEKIESLATTVSSMDAVKEDTEKIQSEATTASYMHVKNDERLGPDATTISDIGTDKEDQELIKDETTTSRLIYNEKEESETTNFSTTTRSKDEENKIEPEATTVSMPHVFKGEDQDKIELEATTTRNVDVTKDEKDKIGSEDITVSTIVSNKDDIDKFESDATTVMALDDVNESEQTVTTQKTQEEEKEMDNSIKAEGVTQSTVANENSQTETTTTTTSSIIVDLKQKDETAQSIFTTATVSDQTSAVTKLEDEMDVEHVQPETTAETEPDSVLTNQSTTTALPKISPTEPVTEGKDFVDPQTLTTVPDIQQVVTQAHITTELVESLETSSMNPVENEIDEDSTPLVPPGRIPGEGDCLLNGVTYHNDTAIPNISKCHSNCRCFSSIIKCDPIICSQPPENMDNCQPIYDSDDSCCPSYTCDQTKETIPPQSHSQMSGTESPVGTSNKICNDGNCDATNEEKLQTPSVITDIPELCAGSECLKPQSDTVIPSCNGNNCEAVQPPIPTKYDHPCEGNDCQQANHDYKPCDGENCLTQQSDDSLCSSDNCESSTGKTHIAPIIPDVTSCNGSPCDSETIQPHKIEDSLCVDGIGCKQPSEQDIQSECAGSNCRRVEMAEPEQNVSVDCQSNECMQSSTDPGKYEDTSPQAYTPAKSDISDKTDNLSESYSTSPAIDDKMSTAVPHITTLQESDFTPEFIPAVQKEVTKGPISEDGTFTESPEKDQIDEKTEQPLITDSKDNETTMKDSHHTSTMEPAKEIEAETLNPPSKPYDIPEGPTESPSITQPDNVITTIRDIVEPSYQTTSQEELVDTKILEDPEKNVMETSSLPGILQNQDKTSPDSNEPFNTDLNIIEVESDRTTKSPEIDTTKADDTIELVTKDPQLFTDLSISNNKEETTPVTETIKDTKLSTTDSSIISEGKPTDFDDTQEKEITTVQPETLQTTEKLLDIDLTKTTKQENLENEAPEPQQTQSAITSFTSDKEYTTTMAPLRSDDSQTEENYSPQNEVNADLPISTESTILNQFEHDSTKTATPVYLPESENVTDIKVTTPASEEISVHTESVTDKISHESPLSTNQYSDMATPTQHETSSSRPESITEIERASTTEKNSVDMTTKASEVLYEYATSPPGSDSGEKEIELDPSDLITTSPELTNVDNESTTPSNNLIEIESKRPEYEKPTTEKISVNEPTTEKLDDESAKLKPDISNEPQNPIETVTNDPDYAVTVQIKDEKDTTSQSPNVSQETVTNTISVDMKIESTTSTFIHESSSELPKLEIVTSDSQQQTTITSDILNKVTEKEFEIPVPVTTDNTILQTVDSVSVDEDDEIGNKLLSASSSTTISDEILSEKVTSPPELLHTSTATLNDALDEKSTKTPSEFDSDTQSKTTINPEFTIKEKDSSDIQPIRPESTPAEVSYHQTDSTKLGQTTIYSQEETTPYLVELEEHTHKILEDTTTAAPGSPQYDELTTIQSQPETDVEVDTSTVKQSIETQTTDGDLKVSVSVDESGSSVTETLYHTSELPDKSGLENKFTTPTATISPASEPSQETDRPNILEKDKTEIPTTSEISFLEEEITKETSKPHEEMFTHQSPIANATTLKDQLNDVTTPMASTEPPKHTANEVHPTDELPSPDYDAHLPSTGTSGYGQEPDYVEEDQAFGPGTCRYGGKVYVSAQQIPRDDPCDFCFCFRSDIICLQQSCPPPIQGCHEEPIQGFCCPRYECPVAMATTLNMTTTTTTTTTTLPPHFPTHAYSGSAQRRGCQIKGHIYKVGEVVKASSGPCLHCMCGGDGQMKCDPKVCTPEPMLRQMIAAAVSAKRRR